MRSGGRSDSAAREEPSQPFIVVGMAAEMKHESSSRSEASCVCALRRGVRSSMTFHVRTHPAWRTPRCWRQSAASCARRDRLPIVSAKTMTQHRDRSLTEWAVRAAATLFSAFGALALLLATLGVYGLKAYDVSRRTREIGSAWRSARPPVMCRRLVLREGIRTTIVGPRDGLLLAAGLGKLVSGLPVPRQPVRSGGADACRHRAVDDGDAGVLPSGTPCDTCDPLEALARRING